MQSTIISCITPTYNRSDLLKKAIESSLVQTFENWEMIIIDDNSSDNTEIVVQEYVKKDSRIKYYKNQGKGACAARNLGIEKATGEYIVFLDDDDEHLPHRFESQLAAIIKSKSGFVLSGFVSKNLITGNISGTNNKGLWGMGAGIGIRWIIKKELLIKAGYFDESMPAMQEVELSYRIAKYAIFANHFDVVVSAGNSPVSISKGESGLKGRIMLMQKHADTIPKLEAAWWYFTIGQEYYMSGRNQDAKACFKLAAKYDYRGIFKIAYFYFNFSKLFGGVVKKINNKIFNFISLYHFPRLVDHEVV